MEEAGTVQGKGDFRGWRDNQAQGEEDQMNCWDEAICFGVVCGFAPLRLESTTCDLYNITWSQAVNIETQCGLRNSVSGPERLYLVMRWASDNR